MSTNPKKTPLDMAREKAAETRDARGTAEAQQLGLQRRREQAAYQGSQRERVANLIGQGLSPYQARQEVAAANLKQQEMMAEQARQQGTLYGQVMRDQLNFNQQKELIEQQKMADRNKQVAAIYQSLGPNAAIAGTPEHAQAQAMIAATQGRAPDDPTGGMTPPGGKRTPVQSQAMANSIAQRAQRDFDPSSPTYPIQVIDMANKSGLSPQEQTQALEKATGRPVTTKEGARAMIKDLVRSIETQAKNSGMDSAGNFNTGRKEYQEALKNALESNRPVIDALIKTHGMSADDVNKILKDSKWDRLGAMWDSGSSSEKLASYLTLGIYDAVKNYNATLTY